MSISVWTAIFFTFAGLAYALRDKESPNRFFLGILAALLGLTPLLADIAIKTHHNAETSDLIHKRIGILFDISDETQENFITDYATKATAIEKFQSTFLSHQSLALENDFRGKYSKLANGIVEVPKNRIMSTAMDLVKEAKTEILATSLFSTDWRQRWSSEYFELQKERIERGGIKLQRIFILNDVSRAECEPVFREHARMGVQVSFIDSGQISPDENKDIIIIDRSLAAELVFAANNDVAGGRVIVDPKDVSNYYEIFQSLAAKANPYTP